MPAWDDAVCCDCHEPFLQARVNRASPRCPSCRASYRTEAKKAWREANPHYWRDRHLAEPRVQRERDKKRWPLRYGLTREQYDELRAEGRCEICGTTEPGPKGFAIDHDHSCCSGSGRACGGCVRGLLCHNCNTAIGLMKDDPCRLIAAAEYLQSGRRVAPGSSASR